MSERLSRIGELLAKGVYLHMKKEKEARANRAEKKGMVPGATNELSPTVNVLAAVRTGPIMAGVAQLKISHGR